MMLAWTLFYNPMTISSTWIIWLSLPMLLLLSVIYRTIRIKNINRIWVESLRTFVLLTLGLALFAVAVYVVQALVLQFLS